MKSKFISLFVAGLVVGGSMTALLANSNATSMEEKAVGTAHHDVPVYKNISELSHESDAVFIGKVTSIKGKRNLAVSPDDHTKEDPNIYIEGIDYNVSVSDFLKGSGSNQVVVTEEKQTRNKRGDLLQFEEFQDLNSGDTYVFFVKKAPTGEYYGVGQPYLFELQNGIVSAKTKLQNLAESFVKSDLETFKREVKQSKSSE